MEATLAYDKGLSINQKIENAWKNKRLSLNNLGKFADVISAYEEALKIKVDPKCPKTLGKKGIGFLQLR
jgi:tetratricopeptide (TPR) repeat protein